jgi:hypothetical protein
MSGYGLYNASQIEGWFGLKDGSLDLLLNKYPDLPMAKEGLFQPVALEVFFHCNQIDLTEYKGDE